MTRAAFVLLAAGQGARFKSKTPKQFLPFKGKPLLYWSLANLTKAQAAIGEVVITVPKGWNWKKLQSLGAIPKSLPYRPRVIEGAKTRHLSLLQALGALKKAGAQPEMIFVHDAARPSWPSNWLKEMPKALYKKQGFSGIIPVLPVRETVKHINGTIKTLSDRDRLHFSQTPQLIRSKDFILALQQLKKTSFLDESQILEMAGKKVLAFPGSAQNTKITYPEDVRGRAQTKIGSGYDLHKIKKTPKGNLLLAGTPIPAPYTVIAHSDGDIIYHALSDAILSALGAGDIGQYFPPKSSKSKNMNSSLILDKALDLMHEQNGTLSNISVVVTAQKPKLTPYRAKIQAALSRRLNLAPHHAGITFKTFEGLSPYANKAISCWSTVLIESNEH